MNWILKNKHKRLKALVVALFLVNIFFLKSDTLQVHRVFAAVDVEGECFDNILGNDVSNLAKAHSQAECEAYCKKEHPSVDTTGQCVFTAAKTAAQIQETADKVKKQAPSIGGIFETAIKTILVGVLNLVGWLFAIAATLFAWAIDPVNVSGSNGMLNKQAVKDVWIMVRDLLNMTFILILLFAAFCTIFQVDKWNLKKVWLNILINALLVNFSFPIARFFIDVSNVAFYYFVSHLFSSTGNVTGSTIMAGFGAASHVGDLLKPENYTQYDIAYLIAMIVVVFIMGMTLLIIAALFLVRLIALTMIVMFSPVGFVGYIFPSTSSYADKWWSNLFSYSFFAPIMIFIMAISLRITEAMGKENFNAFMAQAHTNATPSDANWIANAAFLFIPVIILWMGIGIAKSSGIAGADKIVSSVKKGGKWLANMPLNATGISGGSKLWWENFKKKGYVTGSERIEKRAAYVGSKIPFGDKTAYKNLRDKRVKEAGEKKGYDQMSSGEKLSLLEAEKSDINRAALIKSLAEDGAAGKEHLQEIADKFGVDSSAFKQLQSKIATYNTSAAFSYIKDPELRRKRKEAYMDSNKYKPKDQKLDTYKDEEDMGIAIASGNMSLNDLDDIRKKSDYHAKAIDDTVKKVLNDPAHINIIKNDSDPEKVAMEKDGHRRLQLAYLAQTGKLHDSLKNGTAEQRKAVFENLNKDTIKRMVFENDKGKGDLHEFRVEILNNIKRKNIKEAISALPSDQKRKFLSEFVMNTDASVVPGIGEIRDLLSNDPEMKRWVKKMNANINNQSTFNNGAGI